MIWSTKLFVDEAEETRLSPAQATSLPLPRSAGKGGPAGPGEDVVSSGAKESLVSRRKGGKQLVRQEIMNTFQEVGKGQPKGWGYMPVVCRKRRGMYPRESKTGQKIF
ncbi:MAG: hypothetical protein LBR95_05715 [Azoarcus sp.]|jgi:hypothetical protein|nr:hypothetical protein [Azoarcus sp.]